MSAALCYRPDRSAAELVFATEPGAYTTETLIDFPGQLHAHLGEGRHAHPALGRTVQPPQPRHERLHRLLPRLAARRTPARLRPRTQPGRRPVGQRQRNRTGQPLPRHHRRGDAGRCARRELFGGAVEHIDILVYGGTRGCPKVVGRRPGARGDSWGGTEPLPRPPDPPTTVRAPRRPARCVGETSRPSRPACAHTPRPPPAPSPRPRPPPRRPPTRPAHRSPATNHRTYERRYYDQHRAAETCTTKRCAHSGNRLVGVLQAISCFVYRRSMTRSMLPPPAPHSTVNAGAGKNHRGINRLDGGTDGPSPAPVLHKLWPRPVCEVDSADRRRRGVHL